MKCMLLAAGLGTRLRPITLKIPKPAVELLNVPLFFYTVELLRSVNPSEVIVNSHRHPEKIRRLAGAMGIPFQVSHEAEKPLGSGGGLKHAQKHLESEAFIALNADNAIIPASDQLLANLWQAHLAAGDPLATLLTIEDPRVGTEFNGVWFNKKGELKEITKLPVRKDLTGFHFTGIAVYSPRIFKYLPAGESNVFSDAIFYAITKGERITHYSETLGWLETGDSKNFLNASKALLGKYRSFPYLRNLIAKYSPDSVFDDREALTLISASAKIAADSEIKGFAVVGSNVEIGGGSKILDSVLLSGSRTSPGATIQHQITL